MEYDIESILEKYEDDYNPGPRPMAQEPRNMYNQGSSVDHAVRSVDPERDSFKKISNVLGAYRRYRRGEKNPALNFNQFFELYSTENFATGGSAGQLVQPNADGSRPGYSGKPPTTKHLGNGVYEVTHERGSKTYYGKYERNKKSFKKSFGNDKEAAENFVKEGKKTPVAKNVIDIQSEGGTLLEQPKYKANLTKALDEVTALQEKGYGNIDKIVKKYQKLFTQKVGSKTKAGKIIKTGTGSTEYKAITFAINEHAKKLGIQSIDNANVVKALDAYSKIKNPKRGNIPKILKKFNVPEGSFSKYLNTLNLRKKIPLQFGSEAAKKKYYAKIRNDAIREFSSNKFEKFLIAPETALVQKSHMGDLYNQYVRTGNLGYAPNLINQETLKTVDTTLKNYNEQINDLLKNKPKGYRNKIDLLNQKGNDLAAATQGYKKFTGKDPFTGKEFTINFSKPSQELDPTDLLGNKKLSNLTAADKPTLEMLKEDAMKNAKLNKTKTNKISKEILSQLEKLGCGRAAGGRIMFGNGTSCAIKGRKILEEGLKNGFKKSDVGLAQKILGTGKFLKDAVSLRGLFGPAALAFTVAAEAGIVGYDMLSEGKSFREAVGDSLFNYMLGDKTKIDSDKEFIKRLKNIPGSPSQGFRGVTDEDIGKMQYFKESLKDMGVGFKNYNAIKDIEKKIEENTLNEQVNPEFFPDRAFQLDTQLDKAQAENQDYFRTNTGDRVSNYLMSDAAGEGAEALQKSNLMAKQDQLNNAYRSSLKGIESLKKEKSDIAYDLYRMNNPTKPTGYEVFSPAQMSYIMSNIKDEPDNNYGLFGPAELMEGGIASLNVKK